MDVTLLPLDPATDQALAAAPAIAPIRALQSVMHQAISTGALEAVSFGVQHHFSAGLYARELRMPAGSVCVGKLHRTRHLFVLTQGCIRIDDGTGLQELQAPAVLETVPGIKRAIVALTDAVMMTFHVTDSTDLAAIEAAVIVPDDEVMA